MGAEISESMTKEEHERFKNGRHQVFLALKSMFLESSTDYKDAIFYLESVREPCIVRHITDEQAISELLVRYWGRHRCKAVFIIEESNGQCLPMAQVNRLVNQLVKEGEFKFGA